MKYHVIPRHELEQDPLEFDSLGEAVECARGFATGNVQMVVLSEVAEVSSNLKQTVSFFSVEAACDC